ncbi:MAG: hypothetical protein WAV11_01075 [Minisyncoccia bacterium]
MAYLRDLTEKIKDEEFKKSFYDFFQCLKEFHIARINRARQYMSLCSFEVKFKKALAMLECLIDRLNIKSAYSAKVSSIGTMVDRTWEQLVLE